MLKQIKNYPVVNLLVMHFVERLTSIQVKDDVQQKHVICGHNRNRNMGPSRIVKSNPKDDVQQKKK